MEWAMEEAKLALISGGIELVEIDLNDLIEEIVINTLAILTKCDSNNFKLNSDIFNEPKH